VEFHVEDRDRLTLSSAAFTKHPYLTNGSVNLHLQDLLTIGGGRACGIARDAITADAASRAGGQLVKPQHGRVEEHEA